MFQLQALLAIVTIGGSFREGFFLEGRFNEDLARHHPEFSGDPTFRTEGGDSVLQKIRGLHSTISARGHTCPRAVIVGCNLRITRIYILYLREVFYWGIVAKNGTHVAKNGTSIQ